jgi:hypothetical protein
MRTKLTTAFLLLLLAASVASASNQDTSGKSQTAPSTSSSATQAPASKTASPVAPSASDIAAAKASGKVWVTLGTGIYHKGGRWYGKTKDGKFMTEDEAKKAGYKAAKRD